MMSFPSSWFPFGGSPMPRIAVLGSTRGTSCGSAEEANTLLGAKLVSVVFSNQPLAPNTILQRAQQAGVEWHYIPGPEKSMERAERKSARAYFEDTLDRMLREKKIDLIVMVGFMLILSREFIAKWQGKILNVHPSLLPKFAGGMDLDVHQAVLDAKETESGCTVHFATQVPDGGPIMCQYNCAITIVETKDSLKDKVQALEKRALVAAVRKYAAHPNLYDVLLERQALGMERYWQLAIPTVEREWALTALRRHVMQRANCMDIAFKVGLTVAAVAPGAMYLYLNQSDECPADAPPMLRVTNPYWPG